MAEKIKSITSREELVNPFAVNIEVIDPDKVERILERLHIPGDDPRHLSVEIIKKEGLQPKYEVNIDGREIAISTPYDLERGRIGVLGYVKLKTSNDKPEDYYACRSYYRSNSHGIWKYLPDYEANRGDVLRYGKGYSQQSINLPFVLQCVLAKITLLNKDQILKVEKPQNIAVGPAVVSRLTGYGYSPDRDDYYYEVKSSPERLIGKFYGSRHEKPAPDEMVLKYESPDFTKLLTGWEDASEIYGNYKVEVFASKDGKFNFAFARNDKGVAWISAIELANSKVTSTGLRAEWVDGGFLTLPAAEHGSEAGRYAGNPIGDGKYVDMFEHYISKIPVIQEYLKIKGLKQ